MARSGLEHGMVRLAMVWLGEARLGTWFGKVWQGTARYGKARNKARSG